MSLHPKVLNFHDICKSPFCHRLGRLGCDHLWRAIILPITGSHQLNCTLFCSLQLQSHGKTHNFKENSCSFLKNHLRGREAQTEVTPAGSFPRCLKWEQGSQELMQAFFIHDMEGHHLDYPLLPPRIQISRKLESGAATGHPTQVLLYAMQAS